MRQADEHMDDSLDTVLAFVHQMSVGADVQSALQQPLASVINATLAAAGGSEATRRSYQTAIGLFLEYLDQQRGDMIPLQLALSWRPFAEATTVGKRTIWTVRPPAAVLRLVDATLLDGFRLWRKAEGDSSATATIRVYPVRTLLAVANRDGILTPEQARTMNLKVYQAKQKRRIQPVGRRLTSAEVRRLREAVDVQASKGLRDRAILDLMLFLGLRREEVAELSLGAFRQDGGRWWLVFTAKGEKLRRLKIHDMLFMSLAAWCERVGLTFGSEGPLFRSFDRGDHVTDRPIDASVIGRLVTTYGATAGLAPATGPNQLSPHDLRRTCARNAYDNGASLLLVQSMLGHEDPKTTAHYIGAFDDDQETAIDFVRY